MIELWNQGVDLLKEAMLAYAFLFNGNLGAGILAVTFLTRLALMPITLRLARLTSAHQTSLRKVQPELDQLKNRYANDPRRLNDEMQRCSDARGFRRCRLRVVLERLRRLQPLLPSTRLCDELRCLAVGLSGFWILRNLTPS